MADCSSQQAATELYIVSIYSTYDRGCMQIEA